MTTFPYDKKYALPAFGLQNVGNSCYFNSLIQSLLSCPILQQVLSNRSSKKIVHAYNNIADQKINHAGELLNILIEETKNSGNTLHYGWQEDAHEGLMLLLDKIGSDIEIFFNVRYDTNLICDSCKHQTKIEEDKGAKCEIFVDYYDDSKPLAQYLRCNFSMPEDYKCDKCHTTNTTLRRNTLRRISTIVVLTLKKYHRKKIIDFPMSFTINGGRTILKYKIVAQIEHSGGMGGGHYYARCLREDGIYVCNDSSVMKIDKFEPTPNTYMVFYHLDEESLN